MLKFDRIREKIGRVYSPDNKFLGEVFNEVEYLNIRVQIAEQKLEGYYVMFGKDKVHIHPNGYVSDHPPDVYTLKDKLESKLYEFKYGKKRR